MWIADQSDTRPGYGGQILIYEGARLYGKNPEEAPPAVRLDLGAETSRPVPRGDRPESRAAAHDPVQHASTRMPWSRSSPAATS